MKFFIAFLMISSFSYAGTDFESTGKVVVTDISCTKDNSELKVWPVKTQEGKVTPTSDIIGAYISNELCLKLQDQLTYQENSKIVGYVDPENHSFRNSAGVSMSWDKKEGIVVVSDILIRMRSSLKGNGDDRYYSVKKEVIGFTFKNRISFDENAVKH